MTHQRLTTSIHRSDEESGFCRYLRHTFQQASNSMENTGYFVGWGTLSLLNAGLAQSKDRSGLLWWLISLLLGPLATFLIVVLPKGETL
jgi:hypothetical protein